MKNKFLFKTLIDVLYFTFLLAFVAALITIPMGVILSEKPISAIYDNWNIISSIVSWLNFASYLLFLRALYFLRKVAHLILQNQLFDSEMAQKVKTSGNHFLYTGMLHFVTLAFVFIGKLTEGKLFISYDINLLLPFFLVIIGLFFVIQSEAISLAKSYKEENDLTV